MQDNDEIIIDLDKGVIVFYKDGEQPRVINGKGLGICDDINLRAEDGKARVTITFEAGKITEYRGDAINVVVGNLPPGTYTGADIAVGLRQADGTPAQ